MSQPPPENRRRQPRTAVSLLVQLRVDSFEAFLSEYATSLSTSGMFITTESPRDVGEVVYLQFTLKDGSKLIEGLGRVVRVNGTGMGVEFVDFDEASKALIERICREREGKG